MTEPQHPDQPPQHTCTGQAAPAGQALPLAELVAARLAEASLTEQVKMLLKEAFGEGDTAQSPPSPDRIYLESIAVTGFRGIGKRTALKVPPRPGVTLVVGRNGSGKSSIAEGLETAFTGTTMRWHGQDAARRSNWRNLHDAGAPRIEVKLAIAGDAGRSTLTRTWPGADFETSEAEFRWPGHGRLPLDQVPWAQALTDFRPFLSYLDLDRMISGKPAQMYDAIATILGLGYLSAADTRLRLQEKELDTAVKAASEEVPRLIDALYTLEDDDRAVQALLALDTTGGPDIEAIQALVAGLPTAADDGLLADLRATLDLQPPDIAQVGAAIDRLRTALATVEDIRSTRAEDARHRADLLQHALDHSDRHPDQDTCPVCGSDRSLDAAWATAATAQIAALRQEAAAAEDAHRELESAAQAIRDLIHLPPRIPAALTEPWHAWAACRTISDPEQLAEQAYETALTLVDACTAVKKHAARELERRDERWRDIATRLAAWTRQALTAQQAKPRLGHVRKARAWLKALTTELREQRMADFADHSQHIWEQLRQESNIDLTSVSLRGSEKAVVRKLVMDVSVDGEQASALSVMSQGEQHSLALSLFLPRAATADSPFGFIVIDDPVQSMDPAKVTGLAQVLHRLGQDRQLIVFTHDTRLQRAFTSQQLPVTVLEVERGASSQVQIRPVTDPVRQALDDARALASTDNLPPAALTHVLPTLCRIAVENAFTEAAWIRHHRTGEPDHILQGALSDADKLMKLAALALFGDINRTGDVYRQLAARCGWHAVDLLKQCQAGAHAEGTQITDAYRFVDDIEAIAQKVRTPEKSA